MDIVTILLSDQRALSMREFVHGNARYVFKRLTAYEQSQGLEGQLWIFVDWLMNDLSGLEMCRRLRADPQTHSAHITMVLDDGEAQNRRRALAAGADDYMEGPLDREVILERVLALQSREATHRRAGLLTLGQLVIDMNAVQARWSGTPIRTQPNEFRLLCFFANNPDQLLSREQLIAGLGKQEPPIDYRTVDVWIGRLRHALRDAGAGAGMPLRTVRSKGYVFDSDV